ncbi:MAG: S8 family serine peptidase [bacterium]|nr:S8 family serine peptidase [bacterium]
MRKATALLFCFTAFLSSNMNDRAQAASSCPSGGHVSKQQRDMLDKLPSYVQTILQAVRRQTQTTCQSPDFGSLQPGTIDPLSIPLGSALISPATNATAVPDEVVAMFNGDGANIDAIATQNSLTVRSRRRSALLGGVIVRFGISDGRSPTAVTTVLQANGTIDTPGPNHLYQLQGNSPQPSQFEKARYAPGRIGWPSKDSGLTGKDIVIGVIDTAIDPRHPDLKGAVLESYDALPDQPVNNRRHGTAVAGLLAGRSMILGVAPQARLLIARAFDIPVKNARASATTYQILEALDWTISKGAHIINMSFTGPRNHLMSEALSAAAKKNVVLIAAAGNNGPKAPPAFPAAEQSVLAVTATDADDRIYASANVGSYVFVAAPGVDVLTAAPDEGIDMVSGTSFAAPFLSGLAALMLEQNKALTPRQFAKIIAATSHDLGQPGRDQVFGVGLANFAKALEQK